MLRVALVASLAAVPAAAAPRGECRLVDVAFQPMQRTDLSPGVNPPPQIVVWLEDANGVFVDTLFITKQTGSYGLGNRPGRFDFNSGPLWPYGRRVTTFPVWAHRHGLEFPEIVFQNGEDHNLSHPADESSFDLHFCRPMAIEEPAWDALSCASSSVGTDKGMFDPVKRSKYPPRDDLIVVPDVDHPDVAMFAMVNPFDAVSRATPPAGVLANLSWPIPDAVGPGSYTLWAEVAKEFDHNGTFTELEYPSPVVPWATFGVAYRGQPSVLYKVPISIGPTTMTATTDTYAGYGDPDGLDGDVRPPDGTISQTEPGSGALRFALVADGVGGTFRLKVTARREIDEVLPAAPGDMGLADSTNSTATFSFLAPGDDGTIGRVSAYEIRYRAHEPVTEANFDEPGSIDPKLAIEIAEPGEVQTFTLPGLLPATTYSVGIRAVDDCRNLSELTVVEVTTPARVSGEVDACFIATAAYGSPLAADVQLLRDVRDSLLRKTVLGELAVEAYYTFGPAVAGVVGESELLRATARELIAPIVRYARSLTR